MMVVCMGTISEIGPTGLTVPFMSGSCPYNDSSRAACRLEDFGMRRLVACFGRDRRRWWPSCPRPPSTACPGQAMRLTTDAELAEQMGISLERFHQLRKRRRWPCVRLGRFEVRFTDAQIEQIIAMHTESRARPRRVDDRPSVDGQTQRSATRGRRHLSDASGS